MIRIVAGESADPSASVPSRPGLAIGLVLLIAAGAVVASTVSRNTEAQAAAAAYEPAAELKLGYFGNVTHAPALVGVKQGFIARSLGEHQAQHRRCSTPAPPRSRR